MQRFANGIIARPLAFEFSNNNSPALKIYTEVKRVRSARRILPANGLDKAREHDKDRERNKDLAFTEPVNVNVLKEIKHL